MALATWLKHKIFTMEMDATSTSPLDRTVQASQPFRPNSRGRRTRERQREQGLALPLRHGDDSRPPEASVEGRGGGQQRARNNGPDTGRACRAARSPNGHHRWTGQSVGLSIWLATGSRAAAKGTASLLTPSLKD
ncbi:hypothetical protein AAFF_G00283390 [Aldrovandia affinis]|uniref:Uncharacterized protein n=1 Tax=Aldrovandia affinis TaxID=143900 RepID=A0AAD7TAN5_9TELE|nr:hypothetical protein AAFF_G00283390 [Aldrovandia affinis]